MRADSSGPFPQSPFHVASAIQNAVNDDGVRVDVKGDGYSTFKSSNTQTRPQIIPFCAAFSGKFEAGAIRFNSCDIPDGAHWSGLLGDVFVKVEKIGGGLGREAYVPAFGTFSFAAWRARSSAKTFAAGMPRLGSAFMAS
jgi:hypothetical protein